MRYRYSCLIYHQRNNVKNTQQFCLFHAPVGEILEWATIKRLEEEVSVSPRWMNSAKISTIHNFLAEAPEHSLPTSILLTLSSPGYQIIPLQPENNDPIGYSDIKVKKILICQVSSLIDDINY